MNVRSAKNFSIFYATPRSVLALLTVVVLALTLVAAPVAAKKKKKPSDPVDLFNPILGFEYSHWLVGPIVDIASVEEVEAYLALATDEEAAAFIEAFWAQRGEGMSFFDKKPQQIFQERSVEADKRYSEGEVPGRQTDRGKIWILYGEPSEIDFREPRKVDTPTLEVWTYGKDVEKGLDGEQPKTLYRFVDVDGSKVFFTNQKRRPNHFFPDASRRRDGSGGN